MDGFPGSVPASISINKRNFDPRRAVAGVVGVLQSGRGLSTGRGDH